MTNTSISPPDTYNIVPGNVSRISIKNLLYGPSTSQATKNGTKVFAHLLGWFCTNLADQTCSFHVQTGYNSNDVVTLAAQHQDMVARGFDGAVLDWYGQGTRPTEDASHPRIDGTAQKLRAEAATSCDPQGNCSFQFALMEDFGAWKAFCLQSQTANEQQTCIINAILEDVAYANAQYFSSTLSPAYLRINGQPILFFFVDQTAFLPGVDWSNGVWPQVKSGALSRGNPLLVFRNRGGFQDQHGTSDGAYAWVNCNGDITNTSNTVQHCGPIPGGPLQNTDPYGFNYLHDFYWAAKDQAFQQRWGAAWKGYDKSHSAFQQSATARLPQQCGQTWLKTLREMSVDPDGTITDYFNDTKPLNFVQLATWNDYDEGTEIETGIDNCFTFRSGITVPPVNIIKWSLYTESGAYATTDTLDHWEIYYEPTDTGGNNLTLLTDTAPIDRNNTGTLIPDSVDRRGNHTCPPPKVCKQWDFQYDVGTFVNTHPHYIYYVRAVSKPGIINKVSNGIADGIVPTRPPRPPRS